MKPEQWIVGQDTGTSSKTIWAVMMGAVSGHEDNWRYNTPLDADDFSRCYRLLVVVPGWRERLSEVAAMFPKWGPFVREWERLSHLFEDDNQREEMYALMRSLDEEAMLADGWVKRGAGSWDRKDTTGMVIVGGLRLSDGIILGEETMPS